MPIPIRFHQNDLSIEAQGVTIGVLIASALLGNAERQRRKAQGITGKVNSPSDHPEHRLIYTHHRKTSTRG